MTDDRQLTAIDCCRAAGREPSDAEFPELSAEFSDRPEFADLLRRSLAFDVRAAEAMEDVPIPAGLEARLLERLRETTVDLAAPSGAETVDSVAAPAKQPVSRSVSWRTIATLALATAASVTIAVVWQRAHLAQESPTTLVELRNTWHETARVQLTWQKSAQPAPLPISSQVAAARAVWFRIDSATIAYRLTTAAGQDSTYLFVTKPKTDASIAQGLPLTPPSEPFWTEGRGIGQWRENGLVYVLVAEGPERRYREALRQRQSGNVAAIIRQIRRAS